MTLQHHAKFENDPMSGLGDTAWNRRKDGKTDGRTDIHGSFQDSTSARGTKWNNNGHKCLLDIFCLCILLLGPLGAIEV